MKEALVKTLVLYTTKWNSIKFNYYTSYTNYIR